jgi:hypothetical protein
MGHYAKVEDGVVVDVIVAQQDFVATLDGVWIKTSYNTHGNVHYDGDGQPDGGVAIRKNYAKIGGVYDAERDAFYDQQPFPSWTLNEDSCFWEPPIPEPKSDYNWMWDEELYQSDNTQGWVLFDPAT